MRKISFAYNEPRLGTIEIDPDLTRPMDELSDEDIVNMIEEMYPEAIDIEILSSVEYD